MKWLNLIRWKNLLIVFMTQLLVWYCLIYGSEDLVTTVTANTPGTWQYNNGIGFTGFFIPFLMISLSTLLIAAAGYIINDYFDLKIDIINRPDKVVLEKKIPLRTAIIAHTALNVTGLLLAAIIAFKAHHYSWLLLQAGCTVLLWFYSTNFKKQYIIGNVVVALLTALTIVVLVVYNTAIFRDFYALMPPAASARFIDPVAMCAGYCFFAFSTTWMREIVKDMEDYKGDAAEGCMTMPIKKGLQFSQRFTQVLGLITLLALAFIAGYFFSMHYIVLGMYTLAAIFAPLAWWCFFLQKKTTTTHYHQASKWLKVIMLCGIGSLIVYHFTNYFS